MAGPGGTGGGLAHPRETVLKVTPSWLSGPPPPGSDRVGDPGCGSRSGEQAQASRAWVCILSPSSLVSDGFQVVTLCTSVSHL